MAKSELIEHIANQANISKAAADRALSATLDGIRRLWVINLFHWQAMPIWACRRAVLFPA